MKRHQRVLICNRGEIAIRIARAASELGMDSTAVFAPADALALHPRFATDAIEIGAGLAPVAAYLDIDAMIDAAKRTGCDCVHPGYGFLSENPEFARRCHAEGPHFHWAFSRRARAVRRQGAGPRSGDVTRHPGSSPAAVG